MRRVLLSLPPSMADFMNSKPREEGFFHGSDPKGARLGSGGGIVRLLHEAWKSDGRPCRFEEWIEGAPSLVVLAGGQSRRLPAYAACGKVYIPLPALRWATGQAIDGTLLDFMLPEFDRILHAARGAYPVMVCSGDVVLKFPDRLPELPPADVLGLGMWVSPEMASHFGVFFSRREAPKEIDFFKQKPSADVIRSHSADHLGMVDTGVWLLGKTAISILLARCGWDPIAQTFPGGEPDCYELYAGFGPALGKQPAEPDPEISALKAAVTPLVGADFFHLGTNRQLIESISTLQNSQLNQLQSGPMDLKPHPDLYILNSDFPFSKRSAANHHVWVENSILPAEQALASDHILTGIPPLGFPLELEAGTCIDFTPIEENDFCIRCYGFDDPFRGPLESPETLWFGRPAPEWFEKRNVRFPELAMAPETDIQLAPIFPVLATGSVSREFLFWLSADEPPESESLRSLYLSAGKLSAMEICERCNHERLVQQRRDLISRVLPRMRERAVHNPFYRLDLKSAAPFLEGAELAESCVKDPINTSRDAMLRSEVTRRNTPGESANFEKMAFASLASAITRSVRHFLKQPRLHLLPDQIVWGRSPVRLDLAGGWTDTPPYCFTSGGRVVNMAVDINGQPPVQVFMKACEKPVLVLRSIDLGHEVRIETYGELGTYADPGNGFALTKAAFCLAGFHPDFQEGFSFPSLKAQLENFGGGLEVSLLSAVPKGSGLGTSSIIAATLLGTLSDACGLNWDHAAIVKLVLASEQMLTTGGGWQDQAGAIFRGIKLVETEPGFEQSVSLRWVPDHVFTPEGRLASARLYYTGITRRASNILHEIVRGMFLNSGRHLHLLQDIRRNADACFHALQSGSWQELCGSVAESWNLNCALDAGTCPPSIKEIFARVESRLAGGKLLGAGGGGYALFLARDEDAARLLQRELESNPPNPAARFVNFSVSHLGLQVTRS